MVVPFQGHRAPSGASTWGKEGQRHGGKLFSGEIEGEGEGHELKWVVFPLPTQTYAVIRRVPLILSYKSRGIVRKDTKTKLKQKLSLLS